MTVCLHWFLSREHNNLLNFLGKVTRFCDEDGDYHDPVYNCTKREIAEIFEKACMGAQINIYNYYKSLLKKKHPSFYFLKYDDTIKRRLNIHLLPKYNFEILN